MTDSIVVRVANVGSNQEVTLPVGSTVEDAQRFIGSNPDLEVRIGGVQANGDTVLQNGDTLVESAPKVKHG